MTNFNSISGLALAFISLSTFAYVYFSEPAPGHTFCMSPSEELTDYTTTEPVDFAYDVDFRFMNRVSKYDLGQAQTIWDILPCGPLDEHERCLSVQVNSYHEKADNWMKASHSGDVLSDHQKYILSSLDYGDSFSITGSIEKKNSKGCRSTSTDTLVYYMSVIPETPATYKEGKDNLLNYLKNNSKESIMIVGTDYVEPGRITFTIDANGMISRVEMASSCGYKTIDQKMLSLIASIPGQWNPAKNNAENTVSQTLTLFYGNMGC